MSVQWRIQGQIRPWRPIEFGYRLLSPEADLAVGQMGQLTPLARFGE